MATRRWGLRRAGRAAGIALGSGSSCRARQWAATGHRGQSGFRGRQIVSPSSITASLNRPGRSRGIRSETHR